MKFKVSIATSYDVEAEDEKDAEDMAWNNLEGDLEGYEKGRLKLNDIFGSNVEEAGE